MKRPSRRVSAETGDEPVRRAGRRLAILTVGLVCALVLVFGMIVYATTSYVLMQTLQTAVQDRANAVAPAIEHEPLGFRSFPRDTLPRTLRRFFDTSRGDSRRVPLVVVDQNLHVLASFNPPGASLADPTAARQVVRDHLSSLVSSRQVDSDGPYLVYTLRVSRGDGAVRVVQTSISQRGYLDSLRTLLQVLIGASALGLLASAAISGVVTRRALRPIQTALRRQRDFVADAAHELRTPLAIMRTAAELGIAGDATADPQVALEQVLAQNSHLTRLVDDLSLLARADSGAVGLECAPLDLALLVNETVGGIATLAEDRDIRLSVEAVESSVVGDAGRLRQLLLILLDNALKHTPEGGAIVVGVHNADGHVYLQVRDSGSGIDPLDLPHLFDRFYRADRARSSEGTGLGLAIGRWIAEAHGGSLSAANAPDGGALFTLTMPAAH